MADKVVEIDGIGVVNLTRRKGSRNIRIGFTREGEVRVSLPYWAPYKLATEFVKSKKDWILKHKEDQTPESLEDGIWIGKTHQLLFAPDPKVIKPLARVTKGSIIIKYPADMSHTSRSVQAAAKRGALRALKLEADEQLPSRLSALASQHDISFKSVSTKRLSSRWGSCSHKKEIILNTYLMQLPWYLIDYVIIHELAHTIHLNHSADFWDEVEKMLPDAKKRRRELKAYKTLVFAVK